MLRVFVAAALLLLTGCNSLFYHPMVGTLTTPTALGLDFEDFFAESAPGVRLHFWRIAARKGGPRAGTVLHFHGNAENMTSHFLYVAWLAEAGYDVVAFDYRGYGASSGEPDREGLVEDARAALRVAAAKGGDLFVVAQSLGGAVAVPAIVKEAPKSLRAVALDSTFSSYRSVARAKLAEHWFSWPLQWPLSFLVSDDRSPLADAPKFSWPVVVLHAPNDPVVPYAEARRLFAALGSPGKELWDVPGRGHTFAFSDAEEAQPFRERLVRFFKKEASPQ